MKKILILSASPMRDKIIDEMIAEKLKGMGNEVKVAPMLRAGRQAVLEYQPDICVVPPIRNVYARDFAEELKRFRIGVVSRHTEPSCDWPDYKAMNQRQKIQILGVFQYVVDKELVWSADEADILNRRLSMFQTIAIGAVTCDPFFRQDIIKRERNRKKFNTKYKFSGKKKNLLIGAPWGFADSAPDLQINETEDAQKDTKARDRHLDMVCRVHKALGNKWNILMSIHPGVIEEPYKKVADKLGVPLDAESPSFYLKVNVDAIVHAGSTMAIGAHLLGIPAYQFGDVNAKDVNNWWGMPKAMISKVSPYCKSVKALIERLRGYKPRTNANLDTLKNLEKGRYGLMDGKATERVAMIINRIQGKFTPCWPRSPHDYTQPLLWRNLEKGVNKVPCKVCGGPMFVVQKVWLDKLRAEYDITQEIKPKTETMCPHCGARNFMNMWKT